MAKLFTNFIFTTKITGIDNELQNITLKVHKTGSGIGFI